MYVVSLLKLVVRRLGAQHRRTILISDLPLLSAHSVADTFAEWSLEFYLSAFLDTIEGMQQFCRCAARCAQFF